MWLFLREVKSSLVIRVKPCSFLAVLHISFEVSTYQLLLLGWFTLPDGPCDHLAFGLLICLVAPLSLCILIILLDFVGKNSPVNNNFVFPQERSTTLCSMPITFRS